MDKWSAFTISIIAIAISLAYTVNIIISDPRTSAYDSCVKGWATQDTKIRCAQEIFGKVEK